MQNYPLALFIDKWQGSGKTDKDLIDLILTNAEKSITSGIPTDPDLNAAIRCATDPVYTNSRMAIDLRTLRDKYNAEELVRAIRKMATRSGAPPMTGFKDSNVSFTDLQIISDFL